MTASGLFVSSFTKLVFSMFELSLAEREFFGLLFSDKCSFANSEDGIPLSFAYTAPLPINNIVLTATLTAPT